MPFDVLDSDFYALPTLDVARQLLGQWLVVPDPALSRPVRCRIVETEAYTQDDPAAHCYRRKTGRAATLFKTPGLSYVYFIYGMYHCLNVVTEPVGKGGAVLIRALEPLDDPTLKTNGPGRLCKALGITKAVHNEVNLTSMASPLFIVNGESCFSHQVIQTTRIGIKQAADYPWRFYIKDNPWVSVK